MKWYIWKWWRLAVAADGGNSFITTPGWRWVKVFWRLRWAEPYGIFKEPPFALVTPQRWEWLEWLFWRKLCPQPDKAILGSLAITQWLYNFTGRIARRYHKKVCSKCQSR